jgi:hypothetical protein
VREREATGTDIRSAAADVLNEHWRSAGFAVPSANTYPWQWLWDSCFHSIVWADLGDERALDELESVFQWQTPSGFVPHMGYQEAPEVPRELWGRYGSSTITQPPMFGHASRVLASLGFQPTDQILEQIDRAFEHLISNRMTESGLLRIVHPWESGADNTPRWDDWCAPSFDSDRWMRAKLNLLSELRMNDEGIAVRSRAFEVGAASFNALCAFNMLEFAEVAGDGYWRDRSVELAEAIDQRWDPSGSTWVDWSADAHPSLKHRTCDALLPVLVTRDPSLARIALSELADEGRFGGHFGIASTDRTSSKFDPDGYWRGSSWPQLNYLFWVAAVRHAHDEWAARIASATASAVLLNNFSEHWNPDTGVGQGARPQSWATLASAMNSPNSERIAHRRAQNCG